MEPVTNTNHKRIFLDQLYLDLHNSRNELVKLNNINTYSGEHDCEQKTDSLKKILLQEQIHKISHYIDLLMLL